MAPPAPTVGERGFGVPWRLRRDLHSAAPRAPAHVGDAAQLGDSRLTQDRTSVPHGGTLINRAAEGAARDAALERAGSLPTITIGSVGLSDLELIGNAAFSPLTGFMGEAD